MSGVVKTGGNQQKPVDNIVEIRVILKKNPNLIVVVLVIRKCIFGERNNMKTKTKKTKRITKYTQLKVKTGVKSGQGECPPGYTYCPPDYTCCPPDSWCSVTPQGIGYCIYAQ